MTTGITFKFPCLRHIFLYTKSINSFSNMEKKKMKALHATLSLGHRNFFSKIKISNRMCVKEIQSNDSFTG